MWMNVAGTDRRILRNAVDNMKPWTFMGPWEPWHHRVQASTWHHWDQGVTCGIKLDATWPEAVRFVMSCGCHTSLRYTVDGAPFCEWPSWAPLGTLRAKCCTGHDILPERSCVTKGCRGGTWAPTISRSRCRCNMGTHCLSLVRFHTLVKLWARAYPVLAHQNKQACKWVQHGNIRLTELIKQHGVLELY